MYFYVGKDKKGISMGFAMDWLPGIGNLIGVVKHSGYLHHQKKTQQRYVYDHEYAIIEFF